MKILFSFECTWMPIRARVFINFLKSRGNYIDIVVPSDEFDGKSDIKYDSLSNDISILNLDNYDLWFHDLLNYAELGEK